VRSGAERTFGVNQTKSFHITVGTVFALIAIAHIVRIAAEPQMAGDPWFWLLTIVAVALSVWAWRLVWIARAPKDSGGAG
jgi:hypothetical protein